MAEHMNLTGGLDLGLRFDHTAFAVVEKLEKVAGDFDDVPPTYHYNVVDLYRWPIHPWVGYRKIIDQLGARLHRLENLLEAPLYYDVTGPGRQVIPILTHAWQEGTVGYTKPHAITITGAQISTRGGHVAKLDLVTFASRLIDEKRLKIHGDLEFTDILRNELEHYEMKPSKTGDMLYEAGRQGKHDDLVFAVMMALFYAQRTQGPCRPVAA